MKLGIMQPYFLPYLGYFQLISLVDKSILLDDVSYMKGGSINRNGILVHQIPRWITIPLFKASRNRMIREIEVVPDHSWMSRMLRCIENAYAKAPLFNEIDGCPCQDCWN
ncbi:MAG: WbqC family protein [Pirellulales bacterium]|nr:WbqC family protein [Pirellulales bacterium]